MIITSLQKCDIEIIAEDILKDYYGKEAFGVFPTDICKMAIEYFKLNLIYDKLSDDGAVLGVTTYRSTQVKLRRNGKFEIVPLPERTVLIEKNLQHDKKNLGRLRFTVAHECSHHVLFRLFEPQAECHYRKSYEEGKAYTVHQIGHFVGWSERKANELAASLLMPIPMMVSLSKTFGLQGITVYGDGKMIQNERRAVLRAADCIGVSKQAFLIRLKQLNIVDIRSDFDYPGIKGINVWKEV